MRDIEAFRAAVTATLSVRNWARAMHFYKAPFDATELYRVEGGGVAQLSVSGPFGHHWESGRPLS